MYYLSTQPPGEASLQKRSVAAAPTRLGRRVQLPSQLSHRLLLMPRWGWLHGHRLCVAFFVC